MILLYSKVHPFDEKGNEISSYYYNFEWDQFVYFNNEFVNKLKPREVFEHNNITDEYKKRYIEKECKESIVENKRDWDTFLTNEINELKEIKDKQIIVNIPFHDFISKEKIKSNYKRIFDPLNEKFLKIDYNLYKELTLNIFKIGDVLYYTDKKFKKLFQVNLSMLNEVTSKKVTEIVTDGFVGSFIKFNQKQTAIFEIK